MNQNINDVIKNIDKKKEEAKKLLIEIRKLLEQLESTGKAIKGQDTQQNNLAPSDEKYMYYGNENLNSKFKNVGSESDSGVESGAESGLESEAGSGTNATMNVLPLQNQFDPAIEYTHEKIEGYRDVAKNTSDTKKLTPEEKYNIIINAEKRHDYLKDYLNKNKNSPEYNKLNNEYNELNIIFNKCNNPLDKTSDNHCLKIKDNWKGIQERHKIIQEQSTQSSPPSSQQSSQQSSPRLSTPEFKEKPEKDIEQKKKISNILLTPQAEKDKNNKVVLPPITNKRQKVGGKRKSTMKRGKQNKKSQKKSKSHKKSRTHKKRH